MYVNFTNNDTSTDVGIVTSLYNTIEDNPTGIIIKKNV